MVKKNKPISFEISGYEPVIANYLYQGSDHFIRASRYQEPTQQKLEAYIIEHAQICSNVFDQMMEAGYAEQDFDLNRVSWLFYHFLAQDELRPIIQGLAKQDEKIITLLKESTARYPRQQLDYLLLEVYNTIEQDKLKAISAVDKHELFERTYLGPNPFDLHLRLFNGKLPPYQNLAFLLKQGVRDSDALKLIRPEPELIRQPSVEEVVASLYQKKYRREEFTPLHSLTANKLMDTACDAFEDFITRYLYGFLNSLTNPAKQLLPNFEVSANDNPQANLEPSQEDLLSGLGLDPISALTYVAPRKKNGKS